MVQQVTSYESIEGMLKWGDKTNPLCCFYFKSSSFFVTLVLENVYLVRSRRAIDFSLRVSLQVQEALSRSALERN